jgi:hypothetical protein
LRERLIALAGHWPGISGEALGNDEKNFWGRPWGARVAFCRGPMKTTQLFEQLQKVIL